MAIKKKDPITLREDEKHVRVSGFVDSLTGDVLAKIIDQRRLGLDPQMTNVIADRRGDGIGKRTKFPYTYIDGSHAFVISENCVPKAVLGFEFDATRVTVIQMQWIDRINRPLGRWEAALLDLAENFVRQNGLKLVSVKPSGEIGWVKLGKMSPQVAHLRYDVTPARLGYRLVDDWWVKNIE